MKRPEIVDKVLLVLSLCLTLFVGTIHKSSFVTPISQDNLVSLNNVPQTEDQLVVQKSSLYSPEVFAFLALASGAVKANYELGCWVAIEVHDKRILSRSAYQDTSAWWRLGLMGAFGWSFALGFHHAMTGY